MKPKPHHWILMTVLLAVLFAASQDRYLMARAFRRGGTGKVAWHTSFDEAQAVAVREKRPLFVEFSAVWCEPCQEMLSETYRDPDVVHMLNERFVPVLIDIDQDPTMATKFGVSPIPDGVFLATDGQRQLECSIGFHDADAFLTLADGALRAAALPAPEPSPAGLSGLRSPTPPMPGLPPDFPLSR